MNRRFICFDQDAPVPPQAPGLPLVDRCGSARLGPTVSARAPREVALLVRASAVGMRRSWSSRTLAVAACRAAQQGEGALSRIGMIFSTFTIRRVLRVPDQGRDVGSCPAARLACGPEIRAVQCAGGCRGEGPGRAWGAPWAGSPVSRAHLLALGSRALQVQEERLAYALDALSTACRHPELPPVARSCAQGMGGMTIRPCRRCLVLPRCTVPTHHVVLCTKVRSRRPPTGRCSAVLPLS